MSAEKKFEGRTNALTERKNSAKFLCAIGVLVHLTSCATAKHLYVAKEKLPDSEVALVSNESDIRAEYSIIGAGLAGAPFSSRGESFCEMYISKVDKHTFSDPLTWRPITVALLPGKHWFEFLHRHLQITAINRSSPRVETKYQKTEFSPVTIEVDLVKGKKYKATCRYNALEINLIRGNLGECELPMTLAPSFVPRGGEVYDKKSGLTWQRCSVGKQWNESAEDCVGIAKRMKWDDAMETARINDGGWRVPTVEELQTIREKNCRFPAIDNDIFPNTLKDKYWSSTEDGASRAKTVEFDIFTSTTDDRERMGVDRSSSLPARLVRSDGVVPSWAQEKTPGRVVSERLITKIPPSAFGFRVDPNSNRAAYAKKSGSNVVVVMNGQEGKAYDGIGKGYPVFSPNGTRLAYSAQSGKKWSVVVDGQQGKVYDNIGKDTPIFSPDGKRLAYSAQSGNNWFVVVDGEEGKFYDGIGDDSLVFSTDGKRVAYAAKFGSQWSVVVDGQESKVYDSIGKGSLVFSTDGKRVAYVAKIDGQWSVVVDGQEGKAYDDIGDGTPVFSPDGMRVAYLAQTGSQVVVVVDGQEGKAYDGKVNSTPVFSPDSKRVAYAVESGSKWSVVVVVDGQEGKAYDGIMKGTPVFSPDSKRVAYAAMSGVKWSVVVDGQEGKAYDGIMKGNPIFSPDGKQVAYAARSGNNWSVVVDGQEGKDYDMLPKGSQIFFDFPDSLHYLAVKNGRDIYLVEEKLK